MEALAQLRCVDGLSAAPIVNLAAARSRTLEAGAALKAAELVQLARVISSVAVIAGARGAWHAGRAGGGLQAVAWVLGCAAQAALVSPAWPCYHAPPCPT